MRTQSHLFYVALLLRIEIVLPNFYHYYRRDSAILLCFQLCLESHGKYELCKMCEARYVLKATWDV